MTDRHQELLRQHALLREHLAWLERELAREAETPSTFAAPTPRPSVSPVSPKPPATATLHAGDADALLNTYAAEERHNPDSTKRGCLIAFAITLGLVIAGVTAAYFLFYAGR